MVGNWNRTWSSVFVSGRRPSSSSSGWCSRNFLLNNVSCLAPRRTEPCWRQGTPRTNIMFLLTVFLGTTWGLNTIAMLLGYISTHHKTFQVRDCSHQQNNEHVCWDNYFCSGGLSVLYVFCHFLEEVPLLFSWGAACSSCTATHSTLPSNRDNGNT